jgi:hypothetical protein
VERLGRGLDEMASEIRKCYFECLRVEKGKEKNYQFVFNTDFGEYNLEEGEEYYDLFRPGNKYIGVVKASGIPDFIGEEDKIENICTVSYNLEKILSKGVVVWEK